MIAKIKISIVFFFIGILSINAQTDTLYYIPIHKGIQEKTIVLGMSAMGPAYSISENKEYIMKDDYLVRFGVFMEDKFCLGASFTLSDYIQDNNIDDNIYFYGLFARMYQKNDAFNTFIEVGGDFGNKNYMINGLREPIVKQRKAMFGVGITWIDEYIMLELSLNANYLNHISINTNTKKETTVNTMYFQPRIGVNFYF